MTEPSAAVTALTIGTMLAAFATAAATVLLWRVTTALTRETKRMADATAQPQVIVSITPNQWALMYVDLTVENTGAGTAFDIEVEFDPPVKMDDHDFRDRELPLQRISFLKPGQSISSDIGNFNGVRDQVYQVTTSWRLSPDAEDRERLTYALSMKDYSGVGHLGERSPLIAIANQIEKIEKDWSNIASGFKKLRVDVFDSGDRNREKQKMHRSHAAHRKRNQAKGEKGAKPKTGLLGRLRGLFSRNP